MRSIVSFLNKLFGTPAPANSQRAGDVYPELRNRVLTMKPREHGLTHANYPHAVWGVVVEIGSPAGTLTAAGLFDGTASLYYSSGGAITGAGQYAGPNKAAVILVRIANTCTRATMPMDKFPYPRQGEVRFYLLTFTGVSSAAATEEALRDDRHPLSPLLHAARELIAQITSVGQG